jgi:hypothetical protein
MSRSQRTPSRAPSTASNNDMANTNAALLGALMAFGGASKSNGDMLRSRTNSPSTPASSLRGKPSGLSPSPSYRQSATAPATARVSPAAPVKTYATASVARNDNKHDDTTTQRPTPPPLKPKPRRLSGHHYKLQPISPATSFVGILDNNTLRLPTLKQQHYQNEVSSVDMEVRAQVEAASAQGEGSHPHPKNPAQRQEVAVRSGNTRSTSGRAGADHRAQDRTRAQVEARLSEAQNRACSQDLSSSEDDASEEYVSASEDTAQSPTSAPRAGTTPVSKEPPRLPPTRSRPPPGTRRNFNDPSQFVEVSQAPRTSISSTRSMSSQSNPSLNAAYHQLYPRRTTQLTLGEDLANAIVASSLATSRANSPSKLAPPSIAPRRHHHLSPFGSRTPSPTKSTKKSKGMRHTLRDPDSSSSESETEQHPYGKHKKKRHLRPKHPNKHHEGTSRFHIRKVCSKEEATANLVLGDRKRWRDAVTERERKRYEGLFASNRGLLLPPGMSDQISNVVVRDLWFRSRLPQGELEIIWNLAIDSGSEQPARPKTSLSREEFVVGLWLIDQRLKGRKLPVKVSETVWTSVKGLEGIKIKRFPG